MSIIDKIAERHIQQAQARGEFDDLPGQGKPLQLDDDSLVPESLRAGYRMLKNAGYLPPELQLNKEIKEVEALLLNVEDAAERSQAERRLRCLQMQLNQMRGEGINFTVEREYQNKLLEAVS